MNNINKVLISLVNSGKHNLCSKGFVYLAIDVCDNLIENTSCSNCPLCETFPNTKELIDEMRNKYNE